MPISMLISYYGCHCFPKASKSWHLSNSMKCGHMLQHSSSFHASKCYLHWPDTSQIFLTLLLSVRGKGAEHHQSKYYLERFKSDNIFAGVPRTLSLFWFSSVTTMTNGEQKIGQTLLSGRVWGEKVHFSQWIPANNQNRRLKLHYHDLYRHKYTKQAKTCTCKFTMYTTSLFFLLTKFKLPSHTQNGPRDRKLEVTENVWNLNFLFAVNVFIERRGLLRSWFQLHLSKHKVYEADLSMSNCMKISQWKKWN